MDIQALRVLPTLKPNQEWACEGGCDVIRPMHFENVFSESYASDGSSISVQSEFFWTCQNKHLLMVWCDIKNDYVSLPEDFYKEEEPKILESNSIQESIDLLSDSIEQLKTTISVESCMLHEQEEDLENLVAQAVRLGEMYAKRDSQTTSDGFVSISKLHSRQVVVALERRVESQLEASGINADPCRLDGEKLIETIIKAAEVK